MELLYLLFGAIFGALFIWFIRKYRFEAVKGVPKSEFDSLSQQLTAITTEKARTEERCLGLESNLEEAKEQIEKERSLTLSLQSELSKQMADFANLQDKLNNQKDEIEQIQKTFTVEFENLANKIFDDKSKKFTDQNKTNIDDLLKPLGEKIKDFQKKVEETYDKESKQRFLLENEIKRLYELNVQITKDANNLTNALKGESKTQGNWGELILETLLEKSGLQKGPHFAIQQSIPTEDGKRLQPDAVVYLPEEKTIIIDSKVSLTAYERYYSNEDENAKNTALKEHITSIKLHISGLSSKNYHTLYGINSPDFVVMFIPIEPALGIAAIQEPNLFYEATEKNVMLVSPSMLLATLRTIASVWRHESHNRNAMEIARQGGAMYDKFVGFVEDLIKVGKQIHSTQETYEEAMSKLHKGTGNLVKRAQDLKQLGAKTTKILPQQLLDRTEDAETKLPEVQ